MIVTIWDKYDDMILHKHFDADEDAEILLDNCKKYNYTYLLQDDVLELPYHPIQKGENYVRNI